MKISIFIKRFLASMVFLSGTLSSKFMRRSKREFLVVTYHRIIPMGNRNSGIQAGMYVEPRTFEMHLRFLKRYFIPVSLFELLLGSGKTSHNGKPLCAFTFDDGWCDFYETAYPILKVHQVPATVFLPTDFIGNKKWFWTDRLAFLLHQRDNSKKDKALGQAIKNPHVKKLLSLKGSFESRLEKAIEFLKAYPNEAIEKVIEELSMMCQIVPNIPGRAFLSWDEVREMAQSGLINFGSHTASHRVLTTLEEAEIEVELTRSMDKLIAEKVGDPSFIPLSYPNGKYNDKIARMVRDAGYSLAVTTENGWNHNEADRFALKRFSIHQDMTSTGAMLGCRITGIF